MTQNIAAIIILYNPIKETLQRNIEAVINQVSAVILIDNSASPLVLNDVIENNPKIDYIFNNGNLGVAKAQNIGIQSAIDKAFNFVLILDQDSTPASNMVEALVSDYQYLVSQNIPVAVIGPEPINAKTQKPYEPRIRKRKEILGNPNLLEDKEIISSGCIIPVPLFSRVGLMDEKLFIDGVDHEWCWRALKEGYICVISKNATLNHMLGEGDVKIFGIIPIAVPTAFRVYYQYRNYLYLIKKSYVPLYWKLLNGFKYTIKFIYYPVFLKPHYQYLRNAIRGIIHGVTIR